MTGPPDPAPPPGPGPILISEEHLERRVDFERGMRAAPPLTLSLIAVMAALFAVQVARGALDSHAAIVASGAKDNASLARGELWRLLSPAFLHGGWEHLLGNAMALYALGVAAEHLFGRRRFLNLFAATAAAGSLASCLQPGPSVGASGAIFGLMGAVGVAVTRNSRDLLVRDRRIPVVMAVWAAWTLILGAKDPVVDNWAHLGGCAAGAALGAGTRVVVLPHRPAASGPPLLVATAAAAAFGAWTAAAFLPRLLAGPLD